MEFIRNQMILDSNPRDTLSEQHYLEKERFELELKPGEKREVFIKVLPRKRHIQILEEKDLYLGR